MQEMQLSTGEKLREVFSGYESPKALNAAMDARRRELEAQGYTFVGRVKIGRNDRCPCNSGEKFKRCCLSLTQRDGGATYVKLPAGEKDPRPTFRAEEVRP